MSLLEVKPRPSNRKYIVLALCVVLVAAGGVVAKVYVFRPFTPLDSPAGLALGRAVPAFLEDAGEHLQKGGPPDTAKARIDTVLDPKAREALGPDVSARLTKILGTTVDVSAAKDLTDDLRNRFAQEGILLNQALTERGLPYFVDASVVHYWPRTVPVLYTYYIEQEDSLAGGDKHVRSLFVRRLDDLVFRPSVVGYTSPSVSAALVLLDDVEGQLIEFILPCTSAGEDTLLVDLDSIDAKSDWQRDLRERSASIVRTAYANVPAASSALVEELGSLFYRRRALVRTWMKALEKQHERLYIPRRFIPESDYANELVGKIPLWELREWRTIHERLMDRQVLAAFDAIVAERARNVEQHEVQHQLDDDRGKLVVPALIREMLGIVRADDAFDDDHALYVSGEVSAYLAEVARAPGSPSIVLLTLAQNAFNRRSWGSAYDCAAVAVFRGLAKELGAEDENLGCQGINRAAMTRLFIAVTSKPEKDIQAAARRVWESWYEGPLANPKLEKTTAHPAWRH